MRYAFFGDIHGNLEALQSVIARMNALEIDTHVCVGDIVGYGANPQECVDLVRSLNPIAVVGNHDHAATGHIDTSYFNQYARQAALWTQKQLSSSARTWLEGLPFIEHADCFAVAHGSLQAPEMFNYVQTIKDAEYNFDAMDKPLLVLGHSHQPVMFFSTTPITFCMEEGAALLPDIKTIVNCGSVGQPRDEDARASFLVYDDDAQTLVLHRAEYDIKTTQQKIRDAGLPETLALRLALGR